MGFCPALGVMRLTECHGAEKMEAVFAYALPRRLFRVAQLTQLLKMEAGKVPLFAEEAPKVVVHGNLRGMNQYAVGEE